MKRRRFDRATVRPKERAREKEWGGKKTRTFTSILFCHIGLIAVHAFKMWFHLLFICKTVFEFMCSIAGSTAFFTPCEKRISHRFFVLLHYFAEYSNQTNSLDLVSRWHRIFTSILCVLLLEILLQICCRLILCHVNWIANVLVYCVSLIHSFSSAGSREPYLLVFFLLSRRCWHPW